MAEKGSQTLSENTASISSVTYVSSSRPTEQLIRGSCLATNPFAIKTIPMSNSGDGGDEESRPIIAPSTLKLDDDDDTNSAEHLSTSSLTPKVVLRPSRLAVQTEKLDSSANREKPMDKETENDISDKPNEHESTSPENKSVPKPHLFTQGIPTSAPNVFSGTKESSNIDSPSSSFQMAKKEEGSNVGFVFGQNLHERAANYDSSDSDVILSPAKAHDLTFENAAQKSDDKSEAEQIDENTSKKRLSESAKEYESKQSKRKYDEISVITGEEEEKNALQINCKLFEFNMANKSWLERGKGMLRLNDQMCEGVLRSRVVMRTQGNLRVVLNTKVWAGMTVQHPSEKKVQLSAIDAEGVRVFLVMARPKDADQLYSALEYRVSSLKSKSENSNGSADNTATHDKVAFSTENSNSADAYSLNGTPIKRHRSSENDEADSISKFNAAEGEISSDSMKDLKDDSGSS